MNFGLIVSPKAEGTYDSIISQISQDWSNGVVNKFEAKVEKSVIAITQNPYLYPVLDENTEIRRCVLHKNCSMLYKVYDATVVVICFWDNRQDPIAF
jgi:plasmid stabilization system protein ParE